MATSGSYLTSKVVNAYTGDGCPDRANISWSASWDPATLLWTINWSANGAGWTNNYYVTIFSGTVTITDGNGNTLQTKSMSGQIAQARKDVQLIADSFTVGVDTYGNRNIVFSAVFRIGVNGASGESTGSQTFALDQKPMASTFASAPNGVTVTSSGGVSSISLTRYNSSFTHDVTWSFGSYSYTATGQGTSPSYTIPATWLNAIPNSATGTATVTVTTKNGGTTVGSAVSANFTITANVSPSIGSVAVAPRGAAYNAQITNYTTTFVSGYSTALITASSVAGAYGSTIKKVEFIKDGSVISTNTTPTYTYTTGTITGSSATFSVRVTDSRGKTYTKAASQITIKAYAVPSISVNVYRSNSSGTATNDGTYLRVAGSATATPTENSITSFTYATKPTTSSTYGAEANIGSGVTASGYANTTSYDVRITATDKLGQKSYKYFTIPTAEYTMDFKVGGKGVAFGKVAETDSLVDSAWRYKTSHDGNSLSAGVSVSHGTANKESTVDVRRTDANRAISLMVGGGGANRGLYINDGNMDGWLFYYDDANAHIQKPLQLSTPLGLSYGGTGQTAPTHLTSGVITRTSGATLTSQDIIIWGKVIVIRLLVTTTTSYSAGTNMFEGTIASGYRPVMSNTSGGGYYSNAGIIVQAQDTGGINARVISNSVPSSSQVGFSITYIMA